MSIQELGKTHSADIAITAISCDATYLHADLSDGRQISAPLAWYPRLYKASTMQRENYRLIGQGYGVHWPDIDEDISLNMLLEGMPSLEAGR